MSNPPESAAESAPAPAEDGRVTRAKEQREARREQLLEAGRRVFAERGYHATAISDIIDAAEVSRGTFYLYFESKRAIFAEILDEVISHLLGSVVSIKTEPGNPPVMQQLHENVYRVLAVIVDNRYLPHILRRTAVGIDPEFDDKLAEFYKSLTDLLDRTLEQGMELGILRSLNTEIVSHCILGSMKELTTFYLGSDQDENVDTTALVTELIRYNLEGILAK